MTILEANRSDQVFMDYGEFEKYLKSLLGKVEGMSVQPVDRYCYGAGGDGQTAWCEKDRKGEKIKDTTTKGHRDHQAYPGAGEIF